MSHETLLRAEDSLLLLIDLQEKLLPVIAGAEALTHQAEILLEGARELGVPILVSEQVPAKLGPTLPALSRHLEGCPILSKESFSCAGCDAFLDTLGEFDRDQVVLCGVETHICVLQTALDLLEQGVQVHVVADAVGSRLPENKTNALARIAQAGGIITNTESVLFELLRTAKAPAFKAVSKRVR